MSRFGNIRGDTCIQLAPWECKREGFKVTALFELQVVLEMWSDIAGGTIVVPVGYVSDLATIPQFAWSIFLAPDDPRIELGAWVHDLLYQYRGKVTLKGGRVTNLTRAQSDSILANEAMLDLGANAWQRFAVFQALRRCGDGWPGDSFFERFRNS
jgi:hypothetical protein